MAELKYKRVLLKLSGEALAGEKQIGIDPHTVSKICAEIADVVDMGLEVALVIGGGNIFRGLSASAEKNRILQHEPLWLFLTVRMKCSPMKRYARHFLLQLIVSPSLKYSIMD